MRHRLIGFLTLLALLSFSLSTPVAAGGAEGAVFEPIDPEPIIARCRALSLEKRSSADLLTARQGRLETSLCLEQAIIDHAAAVTDRTFLPRDELIWRVDGLRATLDRFYWTLFNKRKNCATECMANNRGTHYDALSSVYEFLLRSVIDHRNFRKI